jgi:hypothetical protein
MKIITIIRELQLLGNENHYGNENHFEKIIVHNYEKIIRNENHFVHSYEKIIRE